MTGSLPAALLLALAASDDAGRRLYEEGIGSAGAPVAAFLGGTRLPGTAVPCAGCHGRDGKGRPEGGVVPPDLTWSSLTRRHGHVHGDGRRHPAFDEAAVARALAEGIDPAGNRLAAAMPRYSLSRADLAALLGYLRRLEARVEPGLGPGVLRLGTVLPTGGPLAEGGAAARRVLEAEARALSRNGGLHGRRIELAVAGFAAGTESAVAAVRRLLAEGPVFAFVGGLAPGEEEELAALLSAEGIPWIGPVAPAAAIRERPERPVFFLHPGLAEEALALARFAAGLPAPGRSLVVVHPGGGAAAATLDALRARGVGGDSIAFPAGALDGRSVARTLRRRKAGSVLFLGTDRELASLAGHLADDPPFLLASGGLVARAVPDLPGGFAGRVFLAYPSLPTDGGPAAATALAARLRAAAVPPAHRSLAASTAAAAAVLAEGLRRAGVDPTRERLVAAVEGLHGFDAGPLPLVGFGPGRRVGNRGAHVVAAGPDGSFRPVGAWLSSDPGPGGR